MKSRNVMYKIFFVSGILAVGFYIFSVYTAFNPPCESNIDDYNMYIDDMFRASEFMPNIDDYSSSDNLEVYYFDGWSQSFTFSIAYNSEEYEIAKENILAKYTFLDEPLKSESGFYYIPDNEFEFDSYHIKVVYDESFRYPEQFGMIAFSDQYKRISYLYFYNRSNNELGDGYEMEEFVENNFIFPKK